MTNENLLTRELLSENKRIEVPAKLFGASGFSFKVEPSIYDMAGMLATKYSGGFWEMYELSNGGWYMSPNGDGEYTVSSMNGFTGTMSADALGITACLFAFSHLSFGGDAFAEVVADQYHLLREYLGGHKEAGLIYAAID